DVNLSLSLEDQLFSIGTRNTMAQRYIRVPVWDRMGNWWEPVDFRCGQQVVDWPDGFDPRTLPTPDYRAGDHVQFVRDETCAREGVVRQVLLQGGMCSSGADLEAILDRWYRDPRNILYIVTARGHDHRIKGEQILGRLVSLEHLSRVLPVRDA